jgi:GNAT superfamily N-acetyltransferase
VNTSIKVRLATIADATEVARLLAMLGHATSPGTPEARLAAFLDKREHALVAYDSSAGASAPLLGVVTLHVTPVMHRAGPIGRFTAVVVDESARGQGIGTILIKVGEAHLAAQGCAMIEVTSNRKRTDAHAFYERLGYESTSFRFAKKVQFDGDEK